MTENIYAGGKQLLLETCPTCGASHAFEYHLYRTAKQNTGAKGFRIHCPNGHSWYYTDGESEKDKLRRERDRLRQQLASKDDEIARQRDWRERAERSASSYKGQVTKLKKRASAGVCPCCSRSFQNLKRHMESKHPDYNVVPLKTAEASK